MKYRFVRVNSDHGNIEAGFWKLNPQHKYLPHWKELYQTDEGGDLSSRKAWCCWMISDPAVENKFRHMPADIQNDFLSNYCPEFTYDDDIIQAVLNVYPDMCLTRAARDLVMAEETLSDRRRFLQDTPYREDEVLMDPETGAPMIGRGGYPIVTKGNFKDLDSMHKNTASLVAAYQDCLATFLHEEEAAIVYGGRELTDRESGVVNLNVKEEWEA